MTLNMTSKRQTAMSSDNHRLGCEKDVEISSNKISPDIMGKSEMRKRRSQLVKNIWTILAGIVLMIAAFRDSIFYQTPWWTASGDFVADQWGRFYNYFDGSTVNIGLALSGITMLHYWAFGGILLIPDLTGWPACVTKYKVQLDQTTIPLGKLGRSLLIVVANQTIVTLPILFGLYHVINWRGFGLTPDELPIVQWLAVEFLVFIIAEETGFYYSHRLFHQPFLYKSVHKMHHEWQTTISLVTIYCHPLEHFLANILPAVLGPVIMGSHLLVFASWLVVAQTSSMISHSGYHLPFLPSSEFHDYHHLKFNNNYGAIGILDWLHGTDAKFKESRQFLRHYTLYELTPASCIIPDDCKKNK